MSHRFVEPLDPNQLLATARRDFPTFYVNADGRDTGTMDSLVLAHATLVMLINTPRESILPTIGTELERTTNAIEQLFASLRESVRACPAYTGLPPAQQLEIEKLVFTVKPPAIISDGSFNG